MYIEGYDQERSVEQSTMRDMVWREVLSNVKCGIWSVEKC
jgi:hypothetical protein